MTSNHQANHFHICFTILTVDNEAFLLIPACEVGVEDRTFFTAFSCFDSVMKSDNIVVYFSIHLN